MGTTDDAAKRNQAWFNYLDRRFRVACTPGTEAHAEGRIEMPHVKFMTFGAATTSEPLWQQAGSWILTSRDIRTNDAGCKRQPCNSAKRAYQLVSTTAAKIPYPDEMSRQHDADWINPPDEDLLEFREAKEQEAVEFGYRGEV